MFKKKSQKVEVKVNRVEETTLVDSGHEIRLRKRESYYEVRIMKLTTATNPTYEFNISLDAAYALGTELQRLHKETEAPADDVWAELERGVKKE